MPKRQKHVLSQRTTPFACTPERTSGLHRIHVDVFLETVRDEGSAKSNVF